MNRPSAFDMHCHLDLYEDFESLIHYCEMRKIAMVTMTTTPRAWPRNKKLCEGCSFVRPALGFHPQLVCQIIDELPLFMSHFVSARYIGEVGLDGGKEYQQSFGDQRRVFEKILEACNQSAGKILSVHSRHASQEVLSVLGELLDFTKTAVVLHWFTGTLKEAELAVQMGCYFSVNAEMIRSQRGAQLVRSLPIDRILTETDGPFTKTLRRPTEPKDVFRTHDRLSELRGMTSEALRNQFFENLSRLTSLK